MKREIVALLLALTMLFSVVALTACNEENPNTPDNPNNSENTTPEDGNNTGGNDDNTGGGSNNNGNNESGGGNGTGGNDVATIEAFTFTYDKLTDTYSVKDYNDSTPKAVIPEEYNGKKVTRIGYRAFYNCSRLTSIEIPASVESIGSRAFEDCTSLKTVTFEDGSKLESIGDGAFVNCSKLTYNEYDNAYYLGSTENPYLVLIKAKSTSITSCEISSNTRFIYQSAFYNCSGLTSITIPSSVTSIGESAFEDCSGLTGVYISDIAAWYNIDFGDKYANPLYYAKKLYLNNVPVEHLTIPSTVTTIKPYAFYNCTSLKTVTFEAGSKLESIGSYAFYDCFGLTSITIPSSVTSIGSYAFYNCTSLKTVTFEAGSKLESIGSYAFYRCSKLTSITIPRSVNSIGSSAFYGCTGLTSITIPANVTSIGSYAFEYCYKLVEVYNRSSLNITTSSDYGYVGYYALNVYKPTSGESKLHNVNDYIFYADGDTVYLVGYIGTDTELILPENYNGSNYAIYEYAFYDNDNITSIEIPASVTSIGDAAFYGCTSLKAVTFKAGSKLERISPFYSFRGCTGLTSITFEDTTTWYRTTSYTNWQNKTGGTEIDVTDSSQNATYFKDTYGNYYWYKL